MITPDLRIAEALENISKQLTRLANTFAYEEIPIVRHTEFRNEDRERVVFVRAGKRLGYVNVRRNPGGGFFVHLSGNNHACTQVETADEAETWIVSKTDL